MDVPLYTVHYQNFFFYLSVKLFDNLWNGFTDFDETFTGR